MIKAQLTIPQWLMIERATRYRMVDLFKIPRSSGTVVVNNVVTTDGHTHEDLSVITVEKMQEFLEDKETTEFFSLLNKVVHKIEKEVENEELKKEQEKEIVAEKKIEQFQEQVMESVKTITELSQEIVKKRGRPSKK